MDVKHIEKDYQNAREKYAAYGVDTDLIMKIMENVSLSLHCWQGDDVRGFENTSASLEGSGIQVTGQYPGRARNAEELREDLEQAFSLIPGKHRLNLHAIYGEFEGKTVDRDEIRPEHFNGWIDWAREKDIKLDFNCTCFSHPKAASGFTLSHKDKSIRDFWIEHVKRCRTISAYMGKELRSPCIHNLWIPDGSKDITVDRMNHRSLLTGSLDQIFEEEFPVVEIKDSLESKLFGIGSEVFVVGSHEFYMGYALSRGKMLCFDIGHFHPTESIADKISAVLQFTDEILLHVSRGIRWDSDHIVILNDEIKDLMSEIIRSNVLDRVHIALDFFDASLNRVGAWVIGARATLKGILLALLEPRSKVLEAENNNDYFTRLAILEEMKSMPFGAVWNYFCLEMGVAAGENWITKIQQYDCDVTKKRV
jgi:L-rhamnose isomerase